MRWHYIRKTKTLMYNNEKCLKKMNKIKATKNFEFQFNNKKKCYKSKMNINLSLNDFD